MDEDNPREQTAPPPDKRASARVPIMLAVSGVVLATAFGTIATVAAAPKTSAGQSPNTRVQVNPYTGQTVGTSQTTTTNATSSTGHHRPHHREQHDLANHDAQADRDHDERPARHQYCDHPRDHHRRATDQADQQQSTAQQQQ